MTGVEIRIDAEELIHFQDNIGRNNDGKIQDTDFSGIVDYLKLNPPVEGSLDPTAKPVFKVVK
ncbi:MAG: hypothetical protein US95_C0003G0022 [Candidatus Woesebacteria bacterium GW2011_GWB1_38_5]|uniref:Uncharacterized protein n=4 Tax=Candidatus Woeseibacteriota TaxID=1752722 RepID=A0A0G0KIW3_9BACT|nr:MAG: hypothetical protein US67_C0052G0007 [Candidatus Woesebacteria bacterium GW2011_GWD1_38_10]KKQ55522.1 MAG: hypothetical protein US75_C0019G0004 [Candidatus Woesebacteria bacterium GW2011_GWC1_38_13]KKQ75470.1 MAG: hypothetical protein US95_C0003G0022 [Candidatus Woesebacteria bacterium GW2011_GWB1_38_5]KKQ84183.1 MAG: hypothetical protein UT06_C0008G0007 [Candidatus Woesebacteria bacterium GW2011_GWA1_38_8]